MTHKEVWTMIDLLAANHKKTVSGLARIAGLDATTFNRSKRFTKLGQERWPSTHSVAKIMRATKSDASDVARIFFRCKKCIKDER
ncbi:MAG: hypothetical protein LBB23_04610 [Rickettsiales bacterium]|jgi:phage repressor protein C with HTH and peptisase S24 domain|nr:hypothetical protein [Rickettsiales bacterium]